MQSRILGRSTSTNQEMPNTEPEFAICMMPCTLEKTALRVADLKRHCVVSIEERLKISDKAP